MTAQPLIDNLTKLPTKSDSPYIADWAELICLTSADAELTVAELAERIERQEDFRTFSGNGSEGADGEPKDDTETPAERKDKHYLKAQDAFEHLIARSVHYGIGYPYEVDDTGNKVSLLDGSLARDAYVFLLICSALSYVPANSESQKLTGAFEHVCVLALRSRLPEGGEAHLFGKNDSKGEGPFLATKLFERLRALCECLGAELHATEEDFSSRNTGDGGLDVVGWLPSGDEIGGKLTFFGQCACTHDWLEKQFSSSDDVWSAYARFVSRPANICYIPFDYRKTDRSWLWPRKVNRTHLIDRFRLMFDLGLCGQTTSDDVVSSLEQLLPRQKIEECRQVLAQRDI